MKQLCCARNLKTKEKFKNFDLVGSSISFYKISKKIFLNLNYNEVSKINNNKEACAIDPGLRKFAAIYSPKEVIQIGPDAHKIIFKICQEIDIIKSRMDRKSYFKKEAFDNGYLPFSKTYFVMNSKRRRSLRKALHKKIQKIKNLREELHNKTINYLCKNYKTIIYPPFETQEMAGKLKSDLARAMYNFAFYKFKQKLKNKAKEYNIHLLIKPEYFTTKTCGMCGFVNLKFGKQEIYECPKCGLRIDRDMNAARNVLLRNLRYT